MHDSRGQEPKPHDAGDDALVLPDGLRQFGNVFELPLVNVLLPAERSREGEREPSMVVPGIIILCLAEIVRNVTGIMTCRFPFSRILRNIVCLLD